MKKILAILFLIPLVVIGQQKITGPVRIQDYDGLNSALRIVNTNQKVSFISINNGTSQVFAVSSNGAVVASGISVVSTNAQFNFYGTNSTPVNASNVVRWVSVSVSGDTNAYRLPLYK